MTKERKIFGVKPIKFVFAMEYVLQGLANPFQGITYQPFFKHFRDHYHMSEAATQTFFSQSYLAWSFKPIIGFFIDAYGKTKVILSALLSMASIFYLLTPFIDRSALMFFSFMFGLSVMLAATDVAVDRATIIEGEEEAEAKGQSKATAVGLNQAICWAAIYGTGIIAAISGGWIADNVSMNTLMVALALVPLTVLAVVLFLPGDKNAVIPLSQSVKNFWEGINTGPILWIMAFYFIFHFQPAMGALWNNHLIENLAFSQTQIGIADGATNLGWFLGVLIFVSVGIKWQDALGLKKLFKIFILLSVFVQLGQYVLVDPWFSSITGTLHQLTGIELQTIRIAWLSTYNLLQGTFIGLVRMSTFSLIGAVIPGASAGSLFAGFMSVANLAYSFSYASGAWLYENGLNFGLLRLLQQKLFGLQAISGSNMSISLLILIGSLAYLLSYAAAHMLPDRRHTLDSHPDDNYMKGPEKYDILGKITLKNINMATGVFALLLILTFTFILNINIISTILYAFFIPAFLRKVFLDWQLKTVG